MAIFKKVLFTDFSLSKTVTLDGVDIQLTYGSVHEVGPLTEAYPEYFIDVEPTDDIAQKIDNFNDKNIQQIYKKPSSVPVNNKSPEITPKEEYKPVNPTSIKTYDGVVVDVNDVNIDVDFVVTDNQFQSTIISGDYIESNIDDYSFTSTSTKLELDKKIKFIHNEYFNIKTPNNQYDLETLNLTLVNGSNKRVVVPEYHYVGEELNIDTESIKHNGAVLHNNGLKLNYSELNLFSEVSQYTTVDNRHILDAPKQEINFTDLVLADSSVSKIIIDDYILDVLGVPTKKEYINLVTLQSSGIKFNNIYRLGIEREKATKVFRNSPIIPMDYDTLFLYNNYFLLKDKIFLYNHTFLLPTVTLYNNNNVYKIKNIGPRLDIVNFQYASNKKLIITLKRKTTVDEIFRHSQNGDSVFNLDLIGFSDDFSVTNSFNAKFFSDKIELLSNKENKSNMMFVDSMSLVNLSIEDSLYFTNFTGVFSDRKKNKAVANGITLLTNKLKNTLYDYDLSGVFSDRKKNKAVANSTLLSFIPDINTLYFTNFTGVFSDRKKNKATANNLSLGTAKIKNTLFDVIYTGVFSDRKKNTATANGLSLSTLIKNTLFDMSLTGIFKEKKSGLSNTINNLELRSNPVKIGVYESKSNGVYREIKFIIGKEKTYLRVLFEQGKERLYNLKKPDYYNLDNKLFYYVYKTFDKDCILYKHSSKVDLNAVKFYAREMLPDGLGYTQKPSFFKSVFHHIDLRIEINLDNKNTENIFKRELNLDNIKFNDVRIRNNKLYESGLIAENNHSSLFKDILELNRLDNVLRSSYKFNFSALNEVKVYDVPFFKFSVTGTIDVNKPILGVRDRIYINLKNIKLDKELFKVIDNNNQKVQIDRYLSDINGTRIDLSLSLNQNTKTSYTPVLEIKKRITELYNKPKAKNDLVVVDILNNSIKISNYITNISDVVISLNIDSNTVSFEKKTGFVYYKTQIQDFIFKKRDLSNSTPIVETIDRGKVYLENDIVLKSDDSIIQVIDLTKAKSTYEKNLLCDYTHLLNDRVYIPNNDNKPLFVINVDNIKVNIVDKIIDVYNDFINVVNIDNLSLITTVQAQLFGRYVEKNDIIYLSSPSYFEGSGDSIKLISNSVKDKLFKNSFFIEPKFNIDLLGVDFISNKIKTKLHTSKNRDLEISIKNEPNLGIILKSGKASIKKYSLYQSSVKEKTKLVQNGFSMDANNLRLVFEQDKLYKMSLKIETSSNTLEMVLKPMSLNIKLNSDLTGILNARKNLAKGYLDIILITQYVKKSNIYINTKKYDIDKNLLPNILRNMSTNFKKFRRDIGKEIVILPFEERTLILSKVFKFNKKMDAIEFLKQDLSASVSQGSGYLDKLYTNDGIEIDLTVTSQSLKGSVAYKNTGYLDKIYANDVIIIEKEALRQDLRGYLVDIKLKSRLIEKIFTNDVILIEKESLKQNLIGLMTRNRLQVEKLFVNDIIQIEKEALRQNLIGRVIKDNKLVERIFINDVIIIEKEALRQNLTARVLIDKKLMDKLFINDVIIIEKEALRQDLKGKIVFKNNITTDKLFINDVIIIEKEALKQNLRGHLIRPDNVTTNRVYNTERLMIEVSNLRDLFFTSSLEIERLYSIEDTFKRENPLKSIVYNIDKEFSLNDNRLLLNRSTRLEDFNYYFDNFKGYLKKFGTENQRYIVSKGSEVFTHDIVYRIGELEFKYKFPIYELFDKNIFWSYKTDIITDIYKEEKLSYGRIELRIDTPVYNLNSGYIVRYSGINTSYFYVENKKLLETLKETSRFYEVKHYNPKRWSYLDTKIITTRNNKVVKFSNDAFNRLTKGDLSKSTRLSTKLEIQAGFKYLDNLYKTVGQYHYDIAFDKEFLCATGKSSYELAFNYPEHIKYSVRETQLPWTDPSYNVASNHPRHIKYTVSETQLPGSEPSYSAYDENPTLDVKEARNSTPYSNGLTNSFSGLQYSKTEPFLGTVKFASKRKLYDTLGYGRKDIEYAPIFKPVFKEPLYSDKPNCIRTRSINVNITRKKPAIYGSGNYNEFFKYYDIAYYDKYLEYMAKLEDPSTICNMCDMKTPPRFNPNKIGVKYRIHQEETIDKFRIRGPYRWDGWYRDIKVYVADKDPVSFAWDRRYETGLLQSNTYYTEKDDKIVLTPLKGTTIKEQVDYWVTNGPYRTRFAIDGTYNNTLKEGNGFIVEDIKPKKSNIPFPHKEYYGNDIYLSKEKAEEKIKSLMKKWGDNYEYKVTTTKIVLEGTTFPLAAPINMHIKGPIKPKATVPEYAFTYKLPENFWKERTIMVFEKESDRISLFSNKVFLQ